MNKFQKRIGKVGKKFDHALVVGTGFGNLNDILEIFRSVFMVNSVPFEKKSKKIIYRENLDNITQIPNINFIFFDLEQIHQLENLKDCWVRNESLVIIEGNDPIGREFSGPLYKTRWGCTSQQGTFHVWEKIK